MKASDIAFLIIMGVILVACLTYLAAEWWDDHQRYKGRR